MSEEEMTVPKQKISFSEADMTLGDLEDFEDITGRSFSDAMKRVKVIDPETGMQAVDPDPEAKGKGLWTFEMSMKGLVAIVFINLRKENPDLKIEDVRNMKFDELDMTPAEDPTAADDSTSKSENSAPSIDEIATMPGSN